MIHLVLILIAPLCWFFYKRGYIKSMDDFGVIHGKDAKRFMERLEGNESVGLVPTPKLARAEEIIKNLSVAEKVSTKDKFCGNCGNPPAPRSH